MDHIKTKYVALIVHLMLRGYSKDIRYIIIYMGGYTDCIVFIHNKIDVHINDKLKHVVCKK